MVTSKGYNKLFKGIIQHVLILTFVPFFFFGYTQDMSLMMIFTASLAFLPIFFSKGKKEFFRELTEKRESVPPLLLICMVFAVVGTNLLGSLLGAGVEKIFYYFGHTITDINKQMSQEVATSPTFQLFLYSCILAPLFEELAFRNVLFRGMEKPRPWLAVILSGAMFALMHANINQSTGLLFTGMYFSYLAMRYSMWVPIFVHAMNNTIFYVLSLFEGSETALAQGVDTAFVVFGLISFVVLVVSAIRHYRKTKTPKEEEKEKPTYTRNPFFWIYFLLSLFFIWLNDFIL